MMKSNIFLSALWATATQALSASQWQSQSIYQIVTDRFARTDGSTTASCNLSQYCGGTWRGIINHLDYIQGMGFTAVRAAAQNYTYISWSNQQSRSGSRQLSRTFSRAREGMYPTCLGTTKSEKRTKIYVIGLPTTDTGPKISRL